MLARLLLDVAGFGFLLIAVLFVALNVYGACSGLRRGRTRDEAPGAASATEGAVPRLTEGTAKAAMS